MYSGTSEAKKAPHVMVVPGFSESIAHNKKLVDALEKEGFDASTFSPPRRTGKVKVSPIMRQAYILSDRIDNKLLAKYSLDPKSEIPNEDKVHLVAHSLGAAAALKTAQLEPKRIASIILMEPEGMSGEQGLLEQFNRAGNKVVNNQALATRSQRLDRPAAYGGYAANADEEKAGKFFRRVAKAQAAAGGVILKNLPLALKEAKAAGKYNINEDLNNVRKLGIPVHIVTSYADDMFDYGKMHTGYNPNTHPSLSVSTVADKNSRHDDPMLHPERTARIIGQLITQR